MTSEAKWKFVKYIGLMGLAVIVFLMGTALYQKWNKDSMAAEAQQSPEQQKNAGSSAGAVCQDGSALEARHCDLGTTLSNCIGPAEGMANAGMNLCYGPEESISYEHEVRNGTSCYRFRAKEGRTTVTYMFKKIPQGEKCPRDLP